MQYLLQILHLSCQVQHLTRSKIKWVFPKFEISVKNLRYSLRLSQFRLKFRILNDRDISFAEIAYSLRTTKNSGAQIVLKCSFIKMTSKNSVSNRGHKFR